MLSHRLIRIHLLSNKLITALRSSIDSLRKVTQSMVRLIASIISEIGWLHLRCHHWIWWQCWHADQLNSRSSTWIASDAVIRSCPTNQRNHCVRQNLRHFNAGSMGSGCNVDSMQFSPSRTFCSSSISHSIISRTS